MNDEKLRRYHQLRDKVVDFITAADAVLAENAQTRRIPHDETLSVFRNKVANDRFELVLIGAYQSGKSTFFNYFCGGRELNPIGCGVRTSACKVSAHYVESPAEEKAVLTWRTPAALLKGVGGALVPEIVDEDRPGGSTCLTEDDIDLSCEADRKRLAAAAWKLLKDTRDSDNDCSDVLRQALIVARYYPAYERRIAEGTTVTSYQEAIRNTSYPVDWETRWERAEKDRDLSCFAEDEVGFAFVGVLDYFVHSPRLKELGCSVTDSPGLFISEWDTEVARQCMTQADAVLFSLNGQTSMNAQELRVLSQCVNDGVQDKLIVGVNVKIPQKGWERLQEIIMGRNLPSTGFQTDAIYPYHAALALRTCEHRLFSEGLVPPETKNGIDAAIKLADWEPLFTDEQRLGFLEDRIDGYLSWYSGGKENWSTYSSVPEAERYAKLVARSGAPAFIAAANHIVAPRKSRSVLVGQGIVPAAKALDDAKFESQKLADYLQKDIDVKKNELDKLENEISCFEGMRNESLDKIREQVDKTKRDITQHYAALAGTKFEARRDALAEAIAHNLPSRAFAIFRDKSKLCQKFMDSARPVFEAIQKEMRAEVAASFKELEPFGKLRNLYEGERARLMSKVEELRGVESLGKIKPEIDGRYAEAAIRMVLGSIEELFRNEVNGRANFWSFLWGIIFVPGWFANKKKRAYAMLDRESATFHRMLGKSMENSLHSEQGPFSLIDRKVQDFEEAFERPLQSLRRLRQEMEESLHTSENHRGLIDSLHRDVERIGQVSAQGMEVKRECEVFCGETN